MKCQTCQSGIHWECALKDCTCPLRCTTKEETFIIHGVNYDLADEIVKKLLHAGSDTTWFASIKLGPENVKRLIGQAIQAYVLKGQK